MGFLLCSLKVSFILHLLGCLLDEQSLSLGRMWAVSQSDRGPSASPTGQLPQVLGKEWYPSYNIFGIFICWFVHYVDSGIILQSHIYFHCSVLKMAPQMFLICSLGNRQHGIQINYQSCFRSTEREGCNLIGCWAKTSSTLHQNHGLHV